MHRRLVLAAVAAALAVPAATLTAPAAAAGPQRCGSTVEGSVRSDGAPTAVGAWWPSLSGDGRLVAFASDSPLTDDALNVSMNIYAHDLRARTTRLVSLSSAGVPADGWSGFPSVDGRGQRVAFMTHATNLVPEDTNEAADVVVRDLARGTTHAVSVGADGRPGGGASASISADGNRVAFHSAAALVAADRNRVDDVYVRDLRRGTTTLASVSTGGVQGLRTSFEPRISADGRFVVFSSAATNLVPGDTNIGFDVFIRDLLRGTTRRVSLVSGTDTETTWGSHRRPSVSAHGRWVAFESDGPLTPGDVDTLHDVYVRDLRTKETVRASTGTHGELPDQANYNATISANGRYVAFESEADTIVRPDQPDVLDIVVKDLRTGTARFGAVTSCGVQANGSSESPALSADGRSVAFTSGATNLVPTVQGPFGVFVHEFPRP
jgi:Tol biopolymer transport system component